MELKSLFYLEFCLFVAVIYFLLQKTDKQKYVLLGASVFFLMINSGKKAVLMVLIFTSVSFLAAIGIEKTTEKRKRQGLLLIGFLSSIGVLLYCKFFSGLAVLVQQLAHVQAIHTVDLIVPMGISYYTLSMYGYLLDVYHKKYPAEKKFFDYLTYLLYFPAIVEGPINLYKKLVPQIRTRHTFDWDRMVNGLQRMLWGYFKKMVVADRIGIFVNGVLQDHSTHGVTIIYAMILYSFQIYTDFSGGIDVIMGISHILGIDLVENFKSPLVSKNVTEYWARWHKSLGEWMEKYIYYPIVLNRNLMKFSRKIKDKYMSRAFTAVIASVVVFIIVGIWHGTGWNYVVYGMYQALFVASAVALKPVYTRIKETLHINEKCLSWNIFCIVRTFVILFFGRLLIKASDLGQAWELIVRMAKLDNWNVLADGSLVNYGLDFKNMIVMWIGVLIVIIVDVMHEQGIKFRETLMKQDIVFRYAVYVTALMVIVIFGIYGKGFDAASFIYQGF